MASENEKVLYTDKLVEIGEDSILFRNYYLLGSKRFPVSNIKEIVYYRAKLWSGRLRLGGWGNFANSSAWWPLDWKRASRDMVFILVPAKSKLRVGFTVEDSQKAMEAFKEIGVELREHKGRKAKTDPGVQ
jgi:hypothetical protein